MRVLLINPPRFNPIRYGKPFLSGGAPSLGIGYIGAVLEEAGHSVYILDAYFKNWRQIKGYINAFNPDVCGISCLTEGRISAFKLVDIIKKEFPKIRIVMGGAHATHLAEQVMENYPVDVICLGEGEMTMLELVNTWSSNGDIGSVNGIVYRTNEGMKTTAKREFIKDLNSIPFPLHRFTRFDEYPDMFVNLKPGGKKKNKLRYVSIVTSRGCPYNCQFCASSEFWGSQYRFRSPQNIVDEIELLYRKYGCRYFNIADDAFSVKKENVIETCREILRRKLDIIWDCTTRVNFVSLEMFEWMKRAGCVSSSFGIESGSEKILKNIKKRIKREQIVSAFDVCHRSGISAHALVMVGNPGEDETTINETIALLKEIKADSVSPSITMVFPATELCDIAKRNGLLTDDYWLTEMPPPYFTCEHDLGALREWSRKIDREINKTRESGKIALIRFLQQSRDSIAQKTGFYFSKKGVELVYKNNSFKL